MVGSRIPSALIVSGTLLVMAYALAWAGVLWSGRAQADDSAAPPAAASDQLAFAVTDAQGREHVMLASPGDQATLLLEVNRRFGEGASIRRMDAHEAAQRRQEQQRLAVSSGRLWLGAALVLPLSLIWAGVRLRRREIAIEQIWSVLETTLSVPMATLLQRTGQTEGALKANLVRISKRGWAELQYHAERVFDGRLSAYSLTLSFCPQCNEPTNARMLADLNQIPTCPACLNPYDRTFLEAQKQETVRALVEQSLQRAREHSADGDFSIARYAVFALLFPPLALSYALAKAD